MLSSLLIFTAPYADRLLLAPRVAISHPFLPGLELLALLALRGHPES
jgi:hypothetical protein